MPWHCLKPGTRVGKKLRTAYKLHLLPFSIYHKIPKAGSIHAWLLTRCSSFSQVENGGQDQKEASFMYGSKSPKDMRVILHCGWQRPPSQLSHMFRGYQHAGQRHQLRLWKTETGRLHCQPSGSTTVFSLRCRISSHGAPELSTCV